MRKGSGKVLAGFREVFCLGLRQGLDKVQGRVWTRIWVMFGQGFWESLGKGFGQVPIGVNDTDQLRDIFILSFNCPHGDCHV